MSVVLFELVQHCRHGSCHKHIGIGQANITSYISANCRRTLRVRNNRSLLYSAVVLAKFDTGCSLQELLIRLRDDGPFSRLTECVTKKKSRS